MKKLLALTSAFAIVSTSSSSVISCNDVSNFEYYTDKIMNSIVDQKVTDDKNTQYSISDYFDSSLKNFKPEADKKTPLLVYLFDEAIRQAINSLVAPKESDSKEYSYELINYTGNSTDGFVEDSSKIIKESDMQKDKTKTLAEEINDFNAFFIKIEADKDSTKWQGKTTPIVDGEVKTDSIFKMKEGIKNNGK